MCQRPWKNRAGMGCRISAPRGGPAPLRRRRDSFPRIMAVGGFFFIFEPIPGETGSVSRSTGETSTTAPLSGHRRLYVAAVRPSTPRRRRRAPGRLGQPRTEPSVSRGQERSASAVCSARTPSSAVNVNIYAIEATRAA